MEECILKAENVSVSYRKKNQTPFGTHQRTQILNGVSFEMKEGEILGLVGESGCGKSTLAKAILNLTPYTGTIRHFSPKPQMIFQDPYGSLNPSKKIGWIMEEPLRIEREREKLRYTRTERQEKVASMLQRVGLDENLVNRYPSQLSGGQRQRICIGTALMQEPKLLIADEPVSALDVTIQAQVLSLLLRLKEEMGLSILFISHDLRVVYQMCDRVIIMQDGRFVEMGDVDEVYFHPREVYTKELLKSAGIFET